MSCGERRVAMGKELSWFTMCTFVLLCTCFFVRTADAEVNFQTTTVSGLANAYHITSGDFNNDTIPDLAVAGWDVNQVTILLGNGLGGFTTAATLATGVHPNFIATGNLDSLGGIDLAITNGGGDRDVTLLFNDGTGTSWTKNTLDIGSDADISSIVAANFTPGSDSDIDLFIVKDSGYVLIDYYEVWQGNGGGLFTKIANENTQLQPIFAATADVDGDTILDMVVANYTSNSITVLLGNGDGTFDESSGSPITVGTKPRMVVAGNLNDDGYIDLAVVNYGSNSVTILLGNGDGTFTSGGTINSSGGTSAAAIGDFDADGFNDLAVTRSSANAVSVLYGNGDGTFKTSTQNLAVGTSPLFIVSGDLDKDGKMDLAVTNYASNNVTILMNRSSVCLAPPADMVSWWSGDGHPFDLIGVNNGTMINGVTYAAGKVGRAFSFDGTNDYVDLPDGASNLINDSAGTITTWVFPTVVGDNDIVVAFGTGSSGEGIGIGIYGNVRIYHHNLPYDWQSTTPMSPNEWTMLTYTWDSTTERIYKNGVFSESRPRSGPSNFNYVPGHARIGHGFWGDTANAFPGLIDEVAVYSRVLSAEEIAAIYNAGGVGKCKSCFTPPSGLVSWWTGDGDGKDIVGFNDGIMMNGATFWTGNVGQAFSFDGVDDYVRVGDATSLRAAQVTVSAWIFSTSDDDTAYIVEKNSTAAGGYHSYALWINFGGKFGARSVMNGFIYDVVSDLTLASNLNKWAHLTMTNDGSRLRLFVDGVFDKETEVGGTIDYGPYPVTIGSYYDNPDKSNSFAGLIDEVQVFGRALSAEEIAAIHAAGGAGMCIPPDTRPDQFSFDDKTDVALDTVTESNVITVAGINGPADISITGGEYSINSGPYTSASGTVESSQNVRVRQTSSSSYSTTTNATLTIGGVSDTFSVTTIPPPEYTITFSSAGGGSIICSPATVVIANASVCTITPDAGYLLAGITDNGTDAMNSVSGNIYTISSVTENHTVEATFEHFTFTPESGTLGTILEMSGPGFGVKKGKVYLEKDGFRYGTKVSEWNQGGTTNRIKATVSKTPPAGRYTIVLISKEVGEFSADDTFEIMAPQVDSASVGLVDGKRIATIRGNYFGNTKKPKVYMNDGAKDLSCKVTSTEGTEIQCYPNKSVVTGTYTVKVIVGKILIGERVLDITIP
jgi:hypothetical protein